MANNRALQMQKARKMMRCHAQAKMDYATIQTADAFRGVQEAVVRTVEAIAPYIQELAERIAESIAQDAALKRAGGDIHGEDMDDRVQDGA